MAQAAALRAGRSLDEQSVHQSSGSTEVPFGAPKAKTLSEQQEDEGKSMRDIDATLSMPNYVQGMPVVIQKGKPHAKPELEALTRKLFQVSEKLQDISSAAINTSGESLAKENPAEVAAAEANMKLGQKEQEEIEVEQESGRDPKQPLPGTNGGPPQQGMAPVAAVIAAALAPSLPRCSRRSHATKTQWSSFFPHASIVA